MKLSDMLSTWPLVEPSQLEADEAAQRVVAAIEGGQLPASVDESLLAAPLPRGADDGETSPPAREPGSAAPASLASSGRVSGISGVENKMSKDRTRDRTSFQELAKMATTPPPPTSSVVPPSAASPAAVTRGKEADSSDSGIVDLKMIASADPSGAQRAQSTPLASSGLFEDDAPKPATPGAVASAAASAPAAAAATASAAPAAAVASAKQAVTAEKKKSGGGVVIALGGLFVLVGAAAGGIFYVKHTHHTEVATNAAVAPNRSPATPAHAAATPSATPTATASVADLDTDDLPATDPNGKPALHAGHVHHHAGAAPATTEEAPKPEGSVNPQLVANIPTGPAGANSGDLASAMKAAAGGGTGLGSGSQTSQGPKYAPGSVPERPSQGQVIGAIGNVMGGARACLPPDSPVSRATITFQSDGTVKDVHVTGFAAGKPAEACIKTALSKAKVDPFAQATYPMTVSIRSSQ